MYNLRRNIINHLKLSENIKEAVTEFFKGTKAKDVIVREHFNSAPNYQNLLSKFNAKVKIIQEKNEYLKSKDKFEKVIKDISSSRLNISDVASKNKIDYKELCKEYRKFNESRSSYKYDRLIHKGIFTFIEEFLLLEQLKSWKTSSSCACRYCALEHLLSLASTFACTKKKSSFKKKIYKRINVRWLYEFEMRHSEELSEFLLYCVNFPFDLPSASQPSLSFNIANVFKSTTSSTHQTPEQIELQKIFNDHKKFDIRQRIKNFLKLSDEFKPIAEEILMSDNLDDVIQKYEIHSTKKHRILYRITDILKDNREFLREKPNFYNTIIFDETLDSKLVKLLHENLKDFKTEKLTSKFKNTYNLLVEESMVYQYRHIICTLKSRNSKRTERSLLTMLQLWVKKFQLSCTCRICALEYLHQLISDPYFVKHMHNDLIHLDKIKKMNEEWLYEFEIRHSVTLSEFSSNCKLDNENKNLWMKALQKLSYLFYKKKILETNTSSIHLQGDRLQTFNVRSMNDIRQRIIDHLNLSGLLKKAAEEVSDNKKNVANVASEHGYIFKKLKTLDKKIDILKKKIEYCSLKDNIEKAIYDISVKKGILTPRLATKYAISYGKLIEEKAKFLLFKLTYEYDEYVSNCNVPTFSDEFSLLEKLDLWKTTSQNCTCQACALEIVFCLAYISANINKSDHQIWEYKMIHGNWICEFEMRHSEVISKFPAYSDCKEKDKFPSSISPSKKKDKILEPSTSSTTYLQSDAKIYKDRMQEQETLHDRFEILKLLSLSKWIQTAAEEVVNKTEEVATVVRKYGFNSQELPDLDERIDILEKRRKYVELKDEIEKAIKTISPDNITEVAKNYKIDKEKLEKEFKKYSDLENKDKYIYDPFTSDDEIFTYKDEFSLLGMLEIWKQSRRSECICWLCTLQHLRKLAYASTKRNKRVIAKQWSTHKKASINWLCEFIMIHSEETSKYLPSCVQYSSTSTSASHPEEETLEPLQKVPRTH